MGDMFYRMISIYLVGIAGIWKAIPVGIALKSHPFETATLTALGSITTVIGLYYSGEPIKRWIMRKWSPEKLESKKGRFAHIMDKYGVVGLGIICPGIFGPISTILVGLLVVPKTSRLMPYLVVGIVLWSFLLTWVAITGVDFFKSLI